MKKAIITGTVAILATGLSTALSGQSPTAYPLEYGESVLPLTLIKVSLTVEKETVVPGPYARYAQKYLGAMAPLSARTTYSISAASLGVEEFAFDLPAPPAEVRTTVSANVYDPTDFVNFPIDRMSSTEKSAETMAQEAANTIFTLRKRRFDLITGEAGEHVYGEGLKAAIEEMARMEEEYVSLFMGKSTRESRTAVYDVVPENGRTNYIVCRFSAGEGLLPESDLGGAPIVLTLTAEGGTTPAGRSDKKTGNLYKIARWMECRVMDGTDELTSKRLPVFQFGETVSGR